MKHKIQASGGTWPNSNREMVAQYLQEFVTFIKSIDFNTLHKNIAANTM
jgi:hypothetical protein